MPRKKIYKEKTRNDLRRLLDNAKVTDKVLADYVATALKSDNPQERIKAADMAAQMRGFDDVDKKVGEEIEHLPLANVKMEDLDRLANRCSYCKHKQFEPLRAVVEPVAIPEITVAGKVEPVLENTNEQNPQEKAD
jgi:hypothetical protein